MILRKRNDWANECPRCYHLEDRNTGPGTHSRTKRCPHCRWPMNVIDVSLRPDLRAGGVDD